MNKEKKLMEFHQGAGTLIFSYENVGKLVCLEEVALIGQCKSLTNCMEDVLEQLLINQLWKPGQRVFQYGDDGVFEITYKRSMSILRPFPNKLELSWKYIADNLKTLEVLYGHS